MIINTLQAVERDFSFMVDQRSEYENIKQAIFSLKHDLIEQVTIFDVFSGKEELETESLWKNIQKKKVIIIAKQPDKNTDGSISSSLPHLNAIEKIAKPIADPNAARLPVNEK